MRTFIAIKLFPEQSLIDALAALKVTLAGEPVKWVPEENLHLTLKFLGDTSPQQVLQVKKELEGISAGCSPVTIFPGGMGFFKNRGVPRVLYIGINGAETLIDIAGKIDNKLEPLGFQRETRPFKPHLTLARIKYLHNKKAFYDAMRKYENLMFSSVKISDIYFFQSVLTPAGPEYKTLAVFPFNGLHPENT